MGMMNNGLSYWQAETEGIDLLDLTMGDQVHLPVVLPLPPQNLS